MKQKDRIGATGENIAARFLMKQGYTIVERNYRRKCGEIDILAKKDGFLMVCEVKSVSCGTFGWGNHETLADFGPERRVNRKKLTRIRRTAELFMWERNVSYETEIMFIVVCVYISLNSGLKSGKFKIRVIHETL